MFSIQPTWQIIYHQPVVHADFAETAGNRVDVPLIDPWFEQLDGEGSRHSWTDIKRQYWRLRKQVLE